MSMPNDLLYRRQGPEEIVLDGWLEDSGPYVSLRESQKARRRPVSETKTAAQRAGADA